MAVAVAVLLFSAVSSTAVLPPSSNTRDFNIFNHLFYLKILKLLFIFYNLLYYLKYFMYNFFLYLHKFFNKTSD